MLFVIIPGTKTKKYEDPIVSEHVVRGTIYDRNGRILAIETPYTSLYFHLSKMKDVKHTASLLSPYLGMSVDEITRQASRYTTYALIKKARRHIRTHAQQSNCGQRSFTRGIAGIPYGTHVPRKFSCITLIGFVDGQSHGLEGIEDTEDDNLSPLPAVGSKDITYGQDITLTLDVDIQYLLDLQLQSIANTHHPDYAAGIVLDAKNGDILAMGSYPWYDASDLSSSTETSRINHAANYLYEPGSVFKIFSLAADMEIGQADFSTPFVCDGSYTFSGITINCHEPHGVVTPREMIAKVATEPSPIGVARPIRGSSMENCAISVSTAPTTSISRLEAGQDSAIRHSGRNEARRPSVSDRNCPLRHFTSQSPQRRSPTEGHSSNRTCCLGVPKELLRATKAKWSTKGKRKPVHRSYHPK